MSKDTYVAKLAAAFAISLLLIPLAYAEQPADPGSTPISIDAKDVSVTEALRMLAKAAGVSIVIGSDVQGILPSIELHDVTVDTALRMIALAHGLYWYKDGDVYIVTATEPKGKTGSPAPAPAATGDYGGRGGAGTGQLPLPAQPSTIGLAQPSASLVGMDGSGIPAPPVASGPSTVIADGDRDHRLVTAFIPLKYASAAQVALMFGGSVSNVPTVGGPGSANRGRNYAVTSEPGLASVMGGAGGGGGGLASLNQYGGGGGGGYGGGGGGNRGGNQGGNNGNNGNNGNGNGNGNGNSRGGGRSGGGFGGGAGGGSSVLQLPSEFMQPPIAYMPQNALIVQGLPDEIDQVKEMVSQLDVVAKQVEISVKFVQVTINATKSFGIDWTVTDSQLEFFNLGFAPASAVNNVVRFSKGRFTATLAAALSDGRATVMAEPIVTTQNNLQAEIDFYTEIPYFSATVTYNEFGNRTVDYSTGGGTGGANGGGNMIYLNNSLTVTPRINGDDSITMECYPEIDQQVGTVTGPNGESMPITSNWYIYVPQVTVADGETLALGGMINKTEDENYRSTPLLSEIPILGELFRSKTKTISNSEVLIFVTPRIVRTIPRE